MSDYSDSDSGTDITCDLATCTADFNRSTVSLTTEDNGQMSIQILTADEILNHMNSCIEEVASLIEEERMVCRLLLNHFNWDTQTLLEKFYSKDKHQLLREANIATLTMRQNSNDDMRLSAHSSISLVVANHPRAPDLDQTAIVSEPEPEFSDALQTLPNGSMTSLGAPQKGEPVRSGAVASPEDLVCGICFCEISSESSGNASFHLACGHVFCKECWCAYLTHSIMGEGMAQNIPCAAFQCRVLVGHTNILALVTDAAVKQKYYHLITNSYVESNKSLRWCPGAGCDKAIKGDGSTSMITCSCGEKFCFQCGESWHFPTPCDWLRKWRVKCSKDSSTSSWIATNTKECPRCKATIEKDGGCNHMICRRDNCGYEFCWVCMGPWQEHGQNAWYNCNRFNDESSKEARSEMEQSRSNLLRFLHYHRRYMNHQQSLKFEDNIYSKVAGKITEIQESHGRAWNEVKFFKLAVDQLCKCRRTLMNTYVFAFYAKPGNQSLIFEDNQRDLELATEQLSEILERDIYKKSADDIQQKLMDKTNYCGRRCSVLISHIREGQEMGWWEVRKEINIEPTTPMTIVTNAV